MRWIIRSVGALVVVAVLAVGALFVIPTERIATIAADRFSMATGRTVEITGEVRPTLWPHLGVRAEGFVIGNPDWVTDGPLIAAEALSIRVPWSAVLSRSVQIDEIILRAPDITLIRDASGRESWAFGSAAAPEALTQTNPDVGDQTEAATWFGLDRAIIEDGRLLYRDALQGQSIEIGDLQAEVALPRSGTARLDGAASINGTRLELGGEINDLTAFLSGDLRPVTLSLDWSGGEIGFTGAASLAPALEGDLTLDATDFGPLAALAGQSPPDLPQGFGRDRVQLTSRVTLASEGTAHLRDAVLQLDDTRLALALDMIPGEDRPLIRGAVSADALALPEADSAAPSTGGQGSGGATTGWSRDPIDVSGLFAADLDLALRVGQVDLGTAALDGIAARLTNTAGRAVVDIDRIDLYGGTLSGQFVANGRGGLSVRTDLILAGVQLSPVLNAFIGYDRLEGTGSASIEVLGVGNDLDTLIRSLEGQGDFALGAGAILGLDIAGMIRNFDDSFRGEGARTVYDSLSANFTITGGVLDNDDLRLDAPWGEVTGAGEVDLGAQTLDYRMIPGVMRDADGVAGIRVPILITGSWANPQIRPDLEFLAQQELAEQAERLEAEAQRRLAEEADRLEAEARARANEALNLGLEEGDTVEDARDALEQRLREEAADQLRNLLGGN